MRPLDDPDRVRAVLAGLLAHVQRREHEVDIDRAELEGLDTESPSFQIAMRHGMAAALHELEHLVMDLQDLPVERLWTQGPLPPLCDEQLATMRRLYPDQAWFWTREWYDGEREIDERRARGKRGTLCMSDAEFQAALDRVPPANPGGGR